MLVALLQPAFRAVLQTFLPSPLALNYITFNVNYDVHVNMEFLYVHPPAFTPLHFLLHLLLTPSFFISLVAIP
jgi:hypothetical protein